MDEHESYPYRRRPDGVPERRNYTPGGRVRRIIHDHRLSALTLMLFVVAAAGLFVATSAWAVNERLTRRVTEMTYLKDTRSLEFVREQEGERTRQEEEK
ncbi:hypothetical protein, partial [Longimicrobium sp.]|uniref:hypothetical protein n=1 Tax=Longimicrobium sp. TaxID=2029185 RepID=UPI002E364A33